jgi:hypothetical protein
MWYYLWLLAHLCSDHVVADHCALWEGWWSGTLHTRLCQLECISHLNQQLSSFKVPCTLIWSIEFTYKHFLYFIRVLCIFTVNNCLNMNLNINSKCLLLSSMLMMLLAILVVSVFVQYFWDVKAFIGYYQAFKLTTICWCFRV